METRAPYALIGLFALAVIMSVFGFVYWLHNSGGLSERTVYRVRFQNTVSGLLTGAAVLFNGIRVGEVTRLELDTTNPEVVFATIAVDASTPVRSDTKAGLDFQGLTGVPVIALQGGRAPLPPRSADGPYVLAADPTAGQSMTGAARDALQRLDTILSDNANPIRATIANLKIFSDALARNSDRLDSVVAGLERMTGGTNAVQVVYELSAPTKFPAFDKMPQTRLTIPEPTAMQMFETRKILVRPTQNEDPSLAKAGWSDTIPRLLQAKILETFETAGLAQNVSRSVEAITAEKQLAIDLRKFQISVSSEPAAEIEFIAKILADGRITDTRTFRASVPIKEINASTAATALDQAFGKCAADLVTWTAGVI